MMRSKASKDSSRGFQVSSEISFLISIRKALPTSGQTIDVTSKIFHLWNKTGSDVWLTTIWMETLRCYLSKANIQEQTNLVFHTAFGPFKR